MDGALAEDEGASDVSTLWEGFRAGKPRAQEILLARHYDEIRRIARGVLRGEGDKLRIQPTDLAHEAAIRVLKLDRMEIRDRNHFLALSARIMRQVLLDEVRQARAAKRSPPVHTTWFGRSGEKSNTLLDIEDFDDALKRFALVDPDRARVVELRFYVGLTLEEVAEQTKESLSTVKRRWRVARAWILNDLGIAEPA